MVKILLIRDDGSLGLDISQKITDIQFCKDALEHMPSKLLEEITRLIAANRDVHRLKPTRRSIQGSE